MFWNRRRKEDNRHETFQLVLLREAVDDIELSFLKDVLEDGGIHILVQERESGDYMRVLTGTSIFGRDVYVEQSQLESAQKLLAEYETGADELEEE